MPLTTAHQVSKVLDAGGDYNPTKDLSPYIDAAVSIVDDLVEYATNLSTPITVTTAKRELLERWLAAHAYGMSDQPLSSRSTEGASGGFQGQTGMYLTATKYGQMAINLDPTGYLTSLAEGTTRPTAGAFWLGTRYSDQPDYVDR